LAAIYFAGLHLGIAGSPIRDRLLAAIGQNAYPRLFSAASLAGLLWLLLAYQYPPYFSTLGAPPLWKPLRLLLMLPSLVLVVLGLGTPTPTVAGVEGLAARSPEGIVRVTRHPLLIGIGLWALVHLIANGDVASFLFFGALAVTALAGTASIDAKRRRALGPA